MSDGELDEGSTWEAALVCAHHRLDNLTAIVDVNRLQADGPTADVLRTEPVGDKWVAFGWQAWRVDGNDLSALLAAFDEVRSYRGSPSVLICDGLTTGYGPSHQATEDLAILRACPGLTIVDPCDAVDIEHAVPALADAPGPTYLRLLRGAVPRVLDEYDYHFRLGRAAELRTGRDVVFISTGLMTMRALSAAVRLEQDRIDIAVLHVPTIKPLDREAILSAAVPDRLMITLENHTVVGGLGEAVAATLAYAGLSRRLLPIGLPDEFLAAGALPTLHDRYGLSTEAVIARVKAELGDSTR